MKPTSLHLLVLLSKASSPSTQAIAKELKTSQQTASRWVLQLLTQGLVEKTQSGYRATDSGKRYLSGLFGGKFFHGKVFTGLGEGRYYLSRKGYLKEFAKIGINPFPGTLNLKLSSAQEIAANNTLRSSNNCFFIKEFNEENRTFGAVKCFSVLIEGKIKGALVYPLRAHYPEDVMELISEEDLRKALSLKDGTVVKVELT